MTKNELQTAVSARKNELLADEALMTQLTEKVASLRGAAEPIITMWENLSSIGKSTISRLLPNLAEKIEELKQKLE